MDYVKLVVIEEKIFGKNFDLQQEPTYSFIEYDKEYTTLKKLLSDVLYSKGYLEFDFVGKFHDKYDEFIYVFKCKKENYTQEYLHCVLNIKVLDSVKIGEDYNLLSKFHSENHNLYKYFN